MPSWPNLRHYTWHFFGKIEDNNKPSSSSLGHDMILRLPRPKRGGGSRYKLPGSATGKRARLYGVRFCLSPKYYYLSIVQMNPFRPSPSHSPTESKSFRFCVKHFSQSVLADAGATKKVSHQDPNLLSAAMGSPEYDAVLTATP